MSELALRGRFCIDGEERRSREVLVAARSRNWGRLRFRTMLNVLLKRAEVGVLGLSGRSTSSTRCSSSVLCSYVGVGHGSMLRKEGRSLCNMLLVIIILLDRGGCRMGEKEEAVVEDVDILLNEGAVEDMTMWLVGLLDGLLGGRDSIDSGEADRLVEGRSMIEGLPAKTTDTTRAVSSRLFFLTGESADSSVSES